MTEQELNMVIAEFLHPNHPRVGIINGVVYAPEPINFDIVPVDYCNNWNDLMPEIIKSNVNYSVTEGVDGWITVMRYVDLEVAAHAPTQQRAMSECFLKLLEAKKEL